MASTPPPRGRKCRTCQMPMKGHKAENCVAPTQFPVTPPTSPPNPVRNTRTRIVEIPMTGHWRAPSWTPHVTLTAPPPAAPSNDPSWVPTVLVDSDGHTIQGSHAVAVSEASADGDADGDGDSAFASDAQHASRPKTPMAQVMDQAHALRLCEPVISIVNVRVADLPRMQATAGQSGLCTSIVRAPWTAPRFKDEFASGANWDHPQEGKTMWVVVGADPTLVQRTADLQQQYERVPGAIKDDLVVVQATYKHIFLASAVSALVVIAAMSVLL
ncbi:hypothetical protein B0H17DRAFT_1217138 [Mycena rosella]|uniref:Uncharacterized protein n=1 Tax=Mycena rosella TaxID=1033263 RepID=A0AAD7C2M4_MYCRO|nr:hypothetical protein B0H17DRAFT_1217138 [Mycena rosella]